MAEVVQLKPQDYKTKVEPVWCPGCGDFGVLSALYQALARNQIPPAQTTLVSGIGCSGRLSAYVKSYGFHTVHGRVLPVAMGVKMANPNLTVIGVGGDGDGYGIGGGHIPHAARRNINVTYIVMNNETYGLTKGQTSPTSPQGHQTGSTPYGNPETPLNPIALAVAYGVSFVARAYSANLQHLIGLFTQALQHRGFALIDVYSPCITFYNTYKTIPPRLAVIDQAHDVGDRVKAFQLAIDPQKIWIGVYYQEQRPTFEEAMLKTSAKAEVAARTQLEQILTKFA